MNQLYLHGQRHLEGQLYQLLPVFLHYQYLLFALEHLLVLFVLEDPQYLQGLYYLVLLFVLGDPQYLQGLYYLVYRQSQFVLGDLVCPQSQLRLLHLSYQLRLVALLHLYLPVLQFFLLALERLLPPCYQLDLVVLWDLQGQLYLLLPETLYNQLTLGDPLDQ